VVYKIGGVKMKGLLNKINFSSKSQIEKEMLEREILDARTALEWSLRF